MDLNIKISFGELKISLSGTDRLDRIETQLKNINTKLDTLLSVSVSPEEMMRLTQATDAASATSKGLEEAIEHNQ